ncbi:MAG: ammonium transporter [Archaeoglobaceae archaeon]
MDGGDIAWLITATAMVMLMTPALGLFYGGMVRSKNVISTITLCYLAYALVSVQWVIIGYTLAFGGDQAGLIGGFEYLGLQSLNLVDLGFVAFQMVFAGLTIAIVVSAMVERIKLSSFLIFALLWTTLVYDPIAHWVWGGGWLAKLGALDFAGGTVVHISSGFSALALALVIGRRSNLKGVITEPHNVPMTLLGGALLWFGWFGFNAGSALQANEIALNAFLVTNTSAASGALAWMIVSWLKGRPGSLGMISGAIAGLVAITPAAGYVDVLSSIAIGSIAGIGCYFAMLLRTKLGIDESLDAWAIHGIGGLWGSIATGIFARINSEGLILGNYSQLYAQIIGAFSGAIYAFVVTFILAKLISALIGLRVEETEEYVGLNIAQHGEIAYSR